jgi:hypothetical protein
LALQENLKKIKIKNKKPTNPAGLAHAHPSIYTHLTLIAVDLIPRRVFFPFSQRKSNRQIKKKKKMKELKSQS